MKNAVFFCTCTDLMKSRPPDFQAIEKRLEEEGISGHTSDRLCSPAGIREFIDIVRRRSYADVLVAACGRAISAELFNDVAAECDINIDQLDIHDFQSDEEIAGKAIFACLEDSLPGNGKIGSTNTALVIGGGVAGCQAALDLGNAGVKVYLVERLPSIGGIMAKLDKTFPTLDCSICILGPKLVDVYHHRDIELVTYADIRRISREGPTFHVQIAKKARYIDSAKCVGCGACAEACPVVVPSVWNMGLKPRKCVRILFEQAIPMVSCIEKDACIECGLCEKVCERGAINFDETEELLEIDADAIIVAAGVDVFDPRLRPEYGYGKIPGVVTNLEFERIVCASGPTEGVLTTHDQKQVKTLAFVLCVGSRDVRFNPNCSGYCCTASIKEAMIAKDHDPDMEIAIFFNDIRTHGKGFEELYTRAKNSGVKFIKAIPGEIVEKNERPVLIYSDFASGEVREMQVDMAVLALGLAPHPMKIPFDKEIMPASDHLGFGKAMHPTLMRHHSTVEGVFWAGTYEGPKDIAESVAQASGAAAGAIARIKGKIDPWN